MHVRAGELQEINQMSRIWTKAITDVVEYMDADVQQIRQQRDDLLSAALFLSMRLRSKLADDTEARPGDRVALLEFDQVRQRIEDHRRLHEAPEQ